MKVSCILTSYNRPKYVRQSLKSLQDQTHQDFEVLLFDDSGIFDIHEVLKDFKLPGLRVWKNHVKREERRSINRLSLNCNNGLKEAKGDLVCFLCDDDYYYPDWFANAVKFFSDKANATKRAGYGVLHYSGKSEMVFGKGMEARFPDQILKSPGCMVDHNQVIHRRFDPPFVWPENWESIGAPDAVYFNLVAKAGNPFHPIHHPSAVKRRHTKNLQHTTKDIGTEVGEGLREPE
jgi:spore maturation protein CgeD